MKFITLTNSKWVWCEWIEDDRLQSVSKDTVFIYPFSSNCCIRIMWSIGDTRRWGNKSNMRDVWAVLYVENGIVKFSWRTNSQKKVSFQR